MTPWQQSSSTRPPGIYPGNDMPSVDKLNIDIADGEFLVLVGPSGCGKSTSLRMLAGLEEVNGGKIWIGDRDVTDLSPKDRDVAMVFQNYALYPHMTVADNMGFALKIAGVDKGEIRKRVEEAAQDPRPRAQYLERKPKALSGGQRQRVAMGRAIVRSPQVFLMDEPLSNLDAKLRVQTRTQIASLQRRLGVTTVYVTHDQVEAMTMGDRVAVLKDGLLQQCDTPRRDVRPPEQRLRRRLHRLPRHEPRSTSRHRRRRAVRRRHRSRSSATASARRSASSVTLGVRPEDLELTDRRAGPRRSSSTSSRSSAPTPTSTADQGGQRARRAHGRRATTSRSRSSRASTAASPPDKGETIYLAPEAGPRAPVRRRVRRAPRRLTDRARRRRRAAGSRPGRRRRVGPPFRARSTTARGMTPWPSRSPRPGPTRRCSTCPGECRSRTGPRTRLAALPRGISRHVVRFVQLSGRVLAVKEIKADIARREYADAAQPRPARTCRASSRSASSAAGPTPTATPLDAVPASPGTCSSRCPTARCSASRCAPTPPPASSTPSPSCSSACTSPASGGVTSRCRTPSSAATPAPSRPTSSTPRPASCATTLSTGQREHDLEIARVNIAGELMDLEAGGFLEAGRRPDRDLASASSPATASCGTSSPSSERFETGDRWRVDERIRRLNELGFDVDELAIIDRPRRHDDPDPAQGRRRRAPLAPAAAAHRPRRRGEPGAPAAQRPRLLPRRRPTARTTTRRSSPTTGSPRIYEPIDPHRPARARRQARARRGLPRGARAPVVPVGAGRPRRRRSRRRSATTSTQVLPGKPDEEAVVGVDTVEMPVVAMFDDN